MCHLSSTIIPLKGKNCDNKHYILFIPLLLFLFSCEYFELQSIEKSFTCGDTLIYSHFGYPEYSGGLYPTVQLGNQCWLAKNLDVGNEIPVDTVFHIYDKNVIEKYCRDQEEFNCDVLGGLYSWEEMMDNETEKLIEKNQGICPDGWHIPSDLEWQILEREYLGIPISETDSFDIVRGEDQRSKDSLINRNSFSAIFAGTYGGFDYSFSENINAAVFWTASLDEKRPDVDAWIRSIERGSQGISRAVRYKGNGYSVRCIKN